MTARIRTIQPEDEPRWRELWDGYCRFYETPMAAEVTRQTWRRLLDPASPMHAIVAEDDGNVVGIANYVVHDTTWSTHPVCYLQDLFVDPAVRGGGVGKALIEWLVAEMRSRNWSRVYWATREDNYRARGLYDKFTPHSGFLRYVVKNPAIPD